LPVRRLRFNSPKILKKHPNLPADGFSSKKKAAIFDIITTPDLSGLVNLRNMRRNRKKTQSIQPNKPKLIIQP